MVEIVLPAVGGAAALGVVAFLVVRRRRRAPRGGARAPSGAAMPRAAGPPAPGPGPSVPPSTTGRLLSALSRTRVALAERLRAALHENRGEERLAAIEEALVLADVGVAATAALIARLRVVLRPDDGSAAIRSRLVQVLCEVFPGESPPEPQPTTRPWVALVTGVNGVGKTTSIGKLAARHTRQGRRVLLVAADTFRAAAGEQLELWAARAGADLVKQRAGSDPAAVVFDGLRAAKARGSDVVIIDTAGRLHTKTNLMEELRKVRRVIGRECPGAPHETLLVLDATTGQNGLQQARIFKDAVEVTGVILTKMDGTAKGGIAVAVTAELGIPIRYVGIGEGTEDLQPFAAEAFVEALVAIEPESEHIDALTGEVRCA
jgi:fused signal recognition particle receptor